MLWKKLGGVALILFVGGCTLFSSDKAAPVIALNETHLSKQALHVVKAGQTLYQIAWQYGCDYRDLATTNRIPAPYVIYPGQTLKLGNIKNQKLPPKKITVKPVTQLAKAATIPVHPKTLPQKAVIASPIIAQKSVLDQAWDWPAKGKIIKSYVLDGKNTNKGVDISGVHGEEIKAASSGKVVYCGSGLRGYGELIIIKHDDVYLSAYAHNSSLLVKEGDLITKGQVIAKMGKTDSDHVKLHFEIRKNGQPINPLAILPKRAV